MFKEHPDDEGEWIPIEDQTLANYPAAAEMFADLCDEHPQWSKSGRGGKGPKGKVWRVFFEKRWTVDGAHAENN
jgi:hypothetical protein